MIRPDRFADVAADARMTEAETVTAYRHYSLGATVAEIARADQVTERAVRYRLANATRKLAALPDDRLAAIGIAPPEERTA